MKRNFTKGELEFELEVRNVRSLRHVAVNVKNTCIAKQQDLVTKKKIAALEIEGRSISAEMSILAWDMTVRDWWLVATEEARLARVGGIYSDGRSGGWLILDQWTERYFEDTLELTFCENCKRSSAQHIGPKCLFGPETFDGGSVSALERIQAVVDYVRWVEAYVVHATAMYAENLAYVVEDLWYERALVEKITDPALLRYL